MPLNIIIRSCNSYFYNVLCTRVQDFHPALVLLCTLLVYIIICVIIAPCTEDDGNTCKEIYMQNKVITDIRENKTNSRYSIFLDDEFAFSISHTDVLYYKLEIGATVSQDKIDRIKSKAVQNKANSTAQEYLSYKPRTRKEVEDKLRSKEFPDDVIENTLDMLAKYNYIDDTQYAMIYIKNKKTLGQARLKYELKLRGVEEAVVSQVLEEYFDDTDEIYETIANLFYKKLGGDTDPDFKEKKRAFDYVLRRGFYFDDAEEGYRVYLEKNLTEK